MQGCITCIYMQYNLYILFELYVFSTGSLAIMYKGIQEYCKKSRYKKTIYFDKFLKELKPVGNTKQFDQQEFKENETSEYFTNELQIFSKEEFGQVRILIINNEPYFVGKDVAEVLESNEPSKAVTRLTSEEDRIKHPILTNGGKQDCWIINESGLYTLIFGSKLQKAKEFKKWVTNEVLPTIRKTGGYVNNAKQFRSK